MFDGTLDILEEIACYLFWHSIVKIFLLYITMMTVCRFVSLYSAVTRSTLSYYWLKYTYYRRLSIHTNMVCSNEYSSSVTSLCLFLGAGPLYSRETASRNFRGFYPPFSVYANEFGYVCDDRYEIGGTFVEGTLK